MQKLSLAVLIAVAAVAISGADANLFGKSIPARTISELYNYAERQDRIISGEPAAKGQFPWQVALTIHLTLGSAFCGASVISENWVLTAAHCAQNAKSFDLRFGAIQRTGSEDGVVTMSSSNYKVHENYNSLFITNDIAVIELPQSLSFTDNIQAVALPSDGSMVGVGEKLTVSGWGLTSDGGSVSPVLNFVELTTISDADCADVYGSVTISGGVVCCRGDPEESTCSGDSGGPLVDLSGSAVQVGVVSFGHVDGCASGQPSGYTRTGVYRSWIRENTGV